MDFSIAWLKMAHRSDVSFKLKMYFSISRTTTISYSMKYNSFKWVGPNVFSLLQSHSGQVGCFCPVESKEKSDFIM